MAANREPKEAERERRIKINLESRIFVLLFVNCVHFKLVDIQPEESKNIIYSAQTVHHVIDNHNNNKTHKSNEQQIST